MQSDSHRICLGASNAPDGRKYTAKLYCHEQRTSLVRREMIEADIRTIRPHRRHGTALIQERVDRDVQLVRIEKSGSHLRVKQLNLLRSCTCILWGRG